MVSSREKTQFPLKPGVVDCKFIPPLGTFADIPCSELRAIDPLVVICAPPVLTKIPLLYENVVDTCPTTAAVKA